MAQWIENDWDYLYPKLEIDGEVDPIYRSNAISEISSRDGIVHAIRQAIFLETPIGAITVFATEHLLEGKPDAEAPISSLDQLSQILTKEKVRNQERIAAISSLSSSLTKMTSTVKSRLGFEYWPDIGLLTEIVTRLERYIASQFRETEQPASSQTADDPVSGAEIRTTASTPAALPPVLNTRAEAIKALALARAYFETHEPSHPAPLLIQRAERLTESDFLSIIKDLMPENLQQLQILLGASEENT
jgi:type VI secretion system protein ImpA